MKSDKGFFPRKRTQIIKEKCTEDKELHKAHRLVCTLMLLWAVIIITDRLLGIYMKAYDSYQQVWAIAGGVLLVLLSYLGTKGYLNQALMIMQINMAVILIQFTATCFAYSQDTHLLSIIYYGFSALILIASSLTLFLNKGIEKYRDMLRDINGSHSKKPLYYRDNRRLIRNK